MDTSHEPQQDLDLGDRPRYRTEDVGADRFLELCRLSREGAVHVFIVECNIPGCRTIGGKPIDGLYRVHYTG